MKLRSGLRFGEDLDAVRAEAVRCRYPLYELSMGGNPCHDSYFNVVRAVLPLDPVLVSNRSWDALIDSVSGGMLSAKGNRFVVVWPDLTTWADPIGAEVLGSIVERLLGARTYLCVYADTPDVDSPQLRGSFDDLV